jgi:predicted permease
MSVLDGVRRDVVTGVRLLARSPAFAATAIATLAVAIGGNTAVFAVVNALVFTPTPVVAPHQLARIDAGHSLMSWLNYQDLRARVGVFQDVLAHRQAVMSLDAAGPHQLRGAITSSNFFDVLGVPASRGRTFTTADARPDRVVLSDRAWRHRFGADPAIVGRVLRLGGAPREVVGVMPARFRGLAPPGLQPEFWVPLDTTTSSRYLTDRHLPQFDVVGRLGPSVGHVQATSALRVAARGLREAHPDLPEEFLGIEAVSVEGVEAFRGMSSVLLPVLAFLGLLAVVSGFVLLIGCANIAGLLVGRAAARQREIAVRLALGARRRRLVRQLLTESLVLAVLGGGAGVVLAAWLVGAANVAVATLPVPVVFDLQIDGRVLGYAIGLSTLTCLFFGLTPALSATRLNLMSSLNEMGGDATRHRLRRVMVAGQVAVCTALLVWSGLFVRSLAGMADVQTGFDASGVVLASARLERGLVADSDGQAIFVEWAQRVGALPGIETAALASVVPLALTGREEFSVSLAEESADARRRVVANRVTPGWFQVVRVSVTAGRDFTWDDRDGAPRVAIVNQTLARQFWGGRAVGQHLRYGRARLEVVGVVADSKYRTIGETIAPAVYLPFQQVYLPEMTLHVRATDAAAAAAGALREWSRLVPDAAVDVGSMTDAVSVAVVPARIGAAATAVFGAVAMLLSALGVYGLVSGAVSERRREIGLRVAIGATGPDIVALVVGGNARLVAAGLVAGLGTGVLGGAALGAFLTGVGPADPAALAAAAGLLAITACGASVFPAWRATRISPLELLRER